MKTKFAYVGYELPQLIKSGVETSLIVDGYIHMKEGQPIIFLKKNRVVSSIKIDLDAGLVTIFIDDVQKFS